MSFSHRKFEMFLLICRVIRRFGYIPIIALKERTRAHMLNLIDRKRIGAERRCRKRGPGSPGWRAPTAVLAVAAAVLGASAGAAKAWEPPKGPVSARYHAGIG